MMVKLMLIGEPGAGKTHFSIEVAKVTGAYVIDVDEGAEPIRQKLKADNITILHGTPWSTFVNSLKTAVRSDTPMIIIDSLTELKEIIKKHIKDKAVQSGKFYLQGMHEKAIQDPDTFIVTWELHPTIYDKIRDVMRTINSAHKSFIVTYHPPLGQSSKGEVKIFKEIIRICDIVAKIDRDTVQIKKDRFFDLNGDYSTDYFVQVIKAILSYDNYDDILKAMEEVK